MKSRRLTIQFNGSEEPVVINTRTGLPITGSERTVPHLHLWRKLSGRPFTDFYQQLIEEQQGKRDELDRSRTTVPAVMEANGMDDGSGEPDQTGNQAQPARSISAPESKGIPVHSENNGKRNSFNLWVACGILFCLAAALLLVVRRRMSKGRGIKS